MTRKTITEKNQEKQILKLLGNKITKIRKEKKLTQAQLGELCNLETTTIWRLENGYVNSKIVNIFKIILELDINLLDLKEEIKEILKDKGADEYE